MFFTSLATPADFADILALQEINHLSNLGELARGDGFLTTYLTLESLENLRKGNGMVIARADNGDLAGFAGAHEWEMDSDRAWPLAVLTLFPLEIGGSIIEASNSFQYGPACVASQFRGQGVAGLLLSAMSANFADRYAFGITFIDFRNARSLAAHQRKLGLQIVADLPFDTTTYRVLSFSTRSFL